jgi:hypothetical protein
MLNGSIIASSDCPTRRLFLELEHDALLAIRRAEKSTEFPLVELGAFLGHQAARWRHEELCAVCAQHRTAAA